MTNVWAESHTYLFNTLPALSDQYLITAAFPCLVDYWLEKMSRLRGESNPAGL